MPDYQRAVDEIRSFLESGDLTVIDQLREAAATYADGCREVNQRLRRCAEFLQQRLYSEAVHLAQAEPAVLDVLAILDFPERDRWQEMALLHDKTAPALQLELAQALNEAYAAVQPLEQLLRRHRLLALARAPLPTRLAVMHEIARLDPDNSFWADDVRVFENKRFEELTRLITLALDSGDADGAAPLLREFRNVSWLGQPPRALVQAVERSTDQHNLAVLKRLEASLHEAHAALDFPLGQKLRDQWVRQAGEIKLDRSNPLLQRAAPALEWVGAEERRRAHERNYDADLARLVEGLNQGVPDEELRQTYARLRQDGATVPADVDDRYHACLTARARAVAFRRGLIAAASAGAVLVVAALIYWGASVASRNSRRAEVVRHVRALLDNRQLAEAKEAIAQLAQADTAATGDADVSQLQERIGAEQTGEQQRLVNFQKALQAAKAAPLSETEPPEIAQARELARLPDEVAALARLVESRRQELERTQIAANDAFQRRVDSVEARLLNLERSMSKEPLNPGELQAVLRGIENEVPSLDADAPKAGAVARDLWKGLKTRLENAQRTLQAQALALGDEESVTQALGGGIDAYAAAVQKYVADSPGSPRAQAFAAALKEKRSWQRVAEWNRLIEPHGAHPVDVSVQDARRLAPNLERFLSGGSDFVDAPTVIQYLLYLRTVAQRDESDADSAAAGLRKLFANSMVADLWILRTANGRIYYLKEDPSEKVQSARRASEPFVNIHHYVGFDGSERPHPLRIEEIRETKRAPQSRLADYIKHLPRNFGDRNWEATTLDVIDRLETDKDFDPIPQVLLLKQVLDFAMKGSYPLSRELKPQAEALDQANLDLTIAWIDPGTDASPLRARATEVLGQLPSLKSVPGAVRKMKAELEHGIAATCYRQAGWLKHDARGIWTCRCAEALPQAWRLFVLIPKDGRSEWREIGDSIDGRMTIQADGADTLAEGRIVFARKQ